ncbi:MAG: hypothetical protein OXB84_06895, partial [Halobacteriovoraceae bacterium]|nr:hypothetical protein [Halobacteriovoraceae bacterium]
DAPASMSRKNHRAIIATSDEHPKDFLSNNPPVYHIDGTVIVDSYQDFFDPKIETRKISELRDGGKFIWTGFSSFWSNRNSNYSPENCNNWSVSNSVGRISNGDAWCNIPYRIICMSYQLGFSCFGILSF